MTKLRSIIFFRNFVGANSNAVNARIFFCTEFNCRCSSRDGVGGDGRAALYVYGSGPEGSSKSAVVPEKKARKSGRGLMAHFRTDLNCRVISRDESDALDSYIIPIDDHVKIGFRKNLLSALYIPLTDRQTDRHYAVNV